MRHTDARSNMKMPEKISLIGQDKELERNATPESKAYHLAKADVFCDLGPEDLKEIADAATMTTCQVGKVFYSPNEQGELLFILK